MTKAASVVRLIPENNDIRAGLMKYCAQIFIPLPGERWKNVGNLFIENGNFRWLPFEKYADLMPRIGVLPNDRISGDSEESGPYSIAMYKIDLYARKISSGELSSNGIVPDTFACSEIDGDDPLFLE